MKPHPFPRYHSLDSAAPLCAPLVWESDTGSLKLERRRELREETSGEVAASYSDGAARFGITHLELLDRSPRGLGVRSHTPLDPGMCVEIRPQGSGTAWVSAMSVRCEPEPGGYRVGLSLAGRKAA